MAMVISSPASFTVCWGLEMEGVGLKPALIRMVLPSLIPPRIPPLWLLPFRKLPSKEGESFSSRKNASLFSEPRLLDTSMPSPISTDFTAPMDITAFAREASSLSKTGSPMPAGSPSTRHSTTPPAESPCSLKERIFCSAKSSAFCRSSVREMPASSMTLARTETPSSKSIFLAMAPAATLAMVSLPEERPPPR